MTEGAGRDSKVGEAEPTTDEAAREPNPAADEATTGEIAPAAGRDPVLAEAGPPADAGSPTAGLRAELGGEAAGPEAPSPAEDGEAAAVAEAPSSPDEGPAGEERRSKGPAPARVEYDDATLTQYVEALLFVSAHPLTVAQIARPLRTTFASVRRAFQTLGERYAVRGIRLMEVGGGYQFRTAPECADVIRRFLDVRPLRLSKAAMETLAVVAYRQPVTKPDVDEIRGVDSGSAVKLLLDRNLVRVLGRKEEPGRPLLYGTTQAFLEFFNLSNLNDLPSLREYAELTEDGRRQLERDLFARSPDALSLDGDDGARGHSPRHWEDLVEVLGADLGGLPEGVEIEVEPSDPLAAYVQDTTFPRPSPEETVGELDEGGPEDDDARLAGGGVLVGEASASTPEEPGDDDGSEDAPDDEDDRP